MIKSKKILLSVIVLALLFVITGCGKKFTVTFNSNGGNAIESQEIKKNERATEPTPPIKNEYIFLYWELDGKKYNFNDRVTKNIILVAKYEKYSGISYLVTFDSNGGSNVSNQIVKEDEKLLKPADPTKEGHKFIYWELDGKEYSFADKVTKNMTLIAKWEKVNTASVGGNENVKKYTVTFNSNGGSSVASKTVISGNKVAKPTDPTKSGYTFIGWYLNDVLYNFNNSITKNITLIAKWQEIVVEDVYTIESGFFQMGSPQVKVFVKKNGIKIEATAVLSNLDVIIGDNKNEFNVILVDQSDYSKIVKAKLSNGTVVNISK